jgi:hypothetical protein
MKRLAFLTLLLLVVLLGRTLVVRLPAQAEPGAASPFAAYPIPDEIRSAPDPAPQALADALVHVTGATVDDFEQAHSQDNWERLLPETSAGESLSQRAAGKGVDASHALALRHDGAGYQGAQGPASQTQLSYSVPQDVRALSAERGLRVSVAFFDELRTDDQQVGLAVTGSDSSADNLSTIMIGIWPELSRDYYVFCTRQDSVVRRQHCQPTPKRRSAGWHTLQINITPLGSYAKVDGENFSYLPSVYLANTTQTSDGGINDRLSSPIELALFVRDASTAGRAYYFDNLAADHFPALLSETALAEENLRLFLRSYENLKLFKNTNGTLVDRYEPGFEAAFNTGILQRLAHAHATRYLIDHAGSRDGLDYQKTTDIIRYMIDSYNYSSDAFLGAWNDPDLNNEGFNDPLNHHLGVITANKLLAISWLLWDELPDDLKRRLAGTNGGQSGVLVDMARKLELLMSSDANIRAWERNEYIGRSKQESNGWFTIFFSGMSLAFPEHPNATCWYNYARFFAQNAFTLNDPTSVGLCDGSGQLVGTINVSTKTINDDLTVDEHHYHPNIQYTLTTVNILTVARMFHKRIRGADDAAFGQRVPEVYAKALDYLDLKTFRYKGAQLQRRWTDSTGAMIPWPFVNAKVNYSPFKPSRKDEGIGDASSMVMYRVIAEIYGDSLNNSANIATIPPDEFVSDDIASHNATYVHFMREGYLWKPTDVYGAALPSETPLTGVFDGLPFETLTGNHMYTLQQNSVVVNDMLGHLLYYDPRLSVTLKPLSLPS